MTHQPLPVTRWKEGDILWAENDFCRMCYVVDEIKANDAFGGAWHPYGDTEIRVQYITQEQGKLWDGCGTEPPGGHEQGTSK